MDIRAEIVIKGAVQGIGFRPFIYRLACRLNLKGFVCNSAAGVIIETEGSSEKVYEFISCVKTGKPHFSIIQSFNVSFSNPKNYVEFKIIESSTGGEPEALIIPDIALCSDCRKELFDTKDRRYLYPFINCTYCGPRYSIIDSLPYDRQNTTMKDFEMCPDCRREYEDPQNRRFHAQSNCCSSCGPSVELRDNKKELISTKEKSIIDAAALIKEGKIIALKGLGGYQLIADALNSYTIDCLRKRKLREGKPLALMFPSIDMIKDYCILTELEEELLNSPESPIILLRRKDNLFLQNNIINIAPGNIYLGVMLPYTPLHSLILLQLDAPIVATSGNLSEDPMCITEEEAFDKLNGIADYFLIHNRRILRPVDDSILKIIQNKEMVLRRARGYAPFPVNINVSSKRNFIAVGAHLKNTISFKQGKNIFVSQHIGDLSSGHSNKNFINTIKDFKRIYNPELNNFISDYHPDYFSTRYARKNGAGIYVQHHLAHIASCYGENDIKGDVLGVAWDGTGLGLDNTIWGGEFFIYGKKEHRHIAQLLQFKIPGGEKAVKDIKYSTAGLLVKAYEYGIFKETKFIKNYYDIKEFELLSSAVNKSINCYQTSSAGRIFDAIAFLLKLCRFSSYEGEAAMMLEYAADMKETGSYPFYIDKQNIYIIDWRETVRKMVYDIELNVHASVISAKFHNTLIKMIVMIAGMVNIKQVVLTGGCFQNSILLEGTINKLKKNGFIPYRHHLIPPNDGGISYGQVIYTLNQLED